MKKMTREWIRKAEKDWLVAGRLNRTARAARETFHDQVCFHCQQSAEEHLKALIQEFGLVVPRTHDLATLETILRPHDRSLATLRRALKILTRYAVEYRYPGMNATKRKADAALRHTQKVRAAVRIRLRFRPDRLVGWDPVHSSSFRFLQLTLRPLPQAPTTVSTAMTHDPEDPEDLPLLNVYQVEDERDGRTRHFIGFMDPVLAGSVGLSSHALIGEFTPGPDGEFTPESFRVNDEFIAAVTAFLNAQPPHSSDLSKGARQIPNQRLFVVDPRNDSPPDHDPSIHDVLGWFQVDPTGVIVPSSFAYNPDHQWFSPDSGISGLLYNRTFYEFLHPEAHHRPEL